VSQISFNPALQPPGAAGAPTTPPVGGSGQTATTNGQSFADVLATRTSTAEAPKFSKHALDRLAQRGIDVSGSTLNRLTDGIQRAAGKGARNSVVFVDGTAFVTSVQNNTVITAVTPENMQSHVFTNIDSAVIA
jgi:flagellar operon protein